MDPQHHVSRDVLRRFDIRRTIGKGGMGIVYHAHDHERNMAVALKRLPKAEPDALYRFKQEFRLLADITHPNLASLYELIGGDDQWFLTMELVDGVDFLAYIRGGASGSLIPFRPPTLQAHVTTDEMETTSSDSVAKRRRKSSHFSPGTSTGPPAQDMPRLKAALQQLASALITLHNGARLHCDIKPSNILVTADGRVVVLDFGLAMQLETVKGPRVPDEYVYGTIAYMSPEQASGEQLSPASDWYAVGAMLYEALTGCLPFGGAAEDVLVAKQTELPPPPRRLNPLVPEALDRVCMRLLAPLPAERATGVQLLRAIGASMIPAISQDAGSSTLVGRDAHLSVLRDAFNDTRRGQAACVFVHGPSGLGKSTLVETFTQAISARDNVLVLAGRCYEQESVQYKALDSLIDALSRHLAQLPPDELADVLPPDARLLARMFPVLQRLPPIAEAIREPGGAAHNKQELRDRAAEVLRRLLAKLAETRPVVLSIDDLQWGDVDSAAILVGLLSPPNPPPVLFVGNYRSEYARESGCLKVLLEPSEGLHRREIVVDALSQEDATLLATRLMGGDALLGAPMAARIAEESRGSPYFVQALVAHVQTESQFASGELLAEGITLDEVLRRRVSRLRPAARRLLEIVALAGRPLNEGDAFSAAGLSTRDPALLTALRSSHLVRGGGRDTPVLETYHDRIRESVVASLPGESSRELHQRLATTLEARGGVDPEWLGAHFHGAGDAATAARYYAQAADIASVVLAFDRAAELYRRSLDLGPGDQFAAQSLRVRLADALANASRSAQAAEVYQAAAKEASGADALELERKAGYQFCIGGQMQKGRSVLGSNLEKVGITLPATARRAIVPLVVNRARLRWLELTGRLRPASSPPAAPREALERLDLIWAAAAALNDVDTVVAASLQARHLIEAIQVQEPGRIASALAMQASTIALEGVRARGRAVRMLDVAEQFADRVGTPYARAMTLLARSNVVTGVNRFPNALKALDEAEELLKRHCTGVTWELSALQMARVMLFRHHGHYGQMVRYAQSVLAEARQRGDLFRLARLGSFIEADTLILMDEPLGAREALRRIRREWIRRDFPVADLFASNAEVEIDVYLGHGRAAWRRLTRYWPALEKSQFLRVEVIRILAYLMRAGTALAAIDQSPGEAGALMAIAERDARRLEREWSEQGATHARLIRAAIAWRKGDRAHAVTLLDQAAGWFERETLGAFAAAARRYQGLAMGNDAGRRLVDHADAFFHSQSVRNPARTAAVHMPGFPGA